MKKRRKLDVSCPNQACSLFGKKGMKNVVKRGFKQNGTRNYTCTTCGKCFVRTAGTLFYRSRIGRKEAKQIANLLVEKNGIRSIGRVIERNRNTIMSFTDKLAGKCKEANDFMLHDVKLSRVEVDEIWTFVKKNKRKLTSQTIRTINKVTATHT
jgi:transposase-like protein